MQFGNLLHGQACYKYLSFLFGEFTNVPRIHEPENLKPQRGGRDAVRFAGLSPDFASSRFLWRPRIGGSDAWIRCYV